MGKEGDFKIRNLRKPENLEMGETSCLLNSILLIVENLPCKVKISKEKICEIFEYDSKDGIYDEKRKFQRLNMYLKQNGCIGKIYHKPFSGKEQLFKQLRELELPVAVYFDIKIIDEIRDKIKDSTGITFANFDSSLIMDVNHILLLVGYSNDGKDLYFIDPNYMLPTYEEEDLKSNSKLIILSSEKFYQNLSVIKQYLEIKYSKKEQIKIKNGLSKFFNENG